jgi:hypothetical protein
MKFCPYSNRNTYRTVNYSHCEDFVIHCIGYETWDLTLKETIYPLPKRPWFHFDTDRCHSHKILQQTVKFCNSLTGGWSSWPTFTSAKKQFPSFTAYTIYRWQCGCAGLYTVQFWMQLATHTNQNITCNSHSCYKLKSHVNTLSNSHVLSQQANSVTFGSRLIVIITP